MEIDPTSFVSGSLADRATAYPALVTAGILTVPEARRRGFGLPASPADTATATAPADALPAGVASVTTEPVPA
jgi:hypothetical protein